MRPADKARAENAVKRVVYIYYTVCDFATASLTVWQAADAEQSKGSTALDL